MSLTTKEEDTLKTLTDCHMWMENGSIMQNKLLYLLLKEVHESRKEAKRTNEILHDIKESLITTQKKVAHLAKAVETYNGDFYHLRTKDVK